MYEGIARPALTVPTRQTAVPGEGVPELHKESTSVLRGIRCVNAVVKVDLRLPPSRPAVLGQPIDEGLTVLLRGVEIGMAQRAPVDVTPGFDRFRVLRAPPFQAFLLLVETSIGQRHSGHDRLALADTS